MLPLLLAASPFTSASLLPSVSPSNGQITDWGLRFRIGCRPPGAGHRGRCRIETNSALCTTGWPSIVQSRLSSRSGDVLASLQAAVATVAAAAVAMRRWRRQQYAQKSKMQKGEWPRRADPEQGLKEVGRLLARSQGSPGRSPLMNLPDYTRHRCWPRIGALIKTTDAPIRVLFRRLYLVIVADVAVVAAVSASLGTSLPQAEL